MTDFLNSVFWHKKRVFVTGCTGLLGSWLTKELIEKGASVVGLVRDLVPESHLNMSKTIEKMTVIRGEIEDYNLLERAINEYEIEIVFHLAAQAIVGTANRHPLATFRTNIAGSWNVLEASRQVGTVKSIVVASSDKAYGSNETLPYVEDMPLQGQHPYDVSKSCADLIARAYHATYGMPVCVTRCGNFFGGGDLNFNRIIPGTIKSVIEGKSPVIRSDGSFVRDYIYVGDVVSAYLLVAERMQDPAIHGEAFNFSNEKQLKVIELTEKILELMGRRDLKPIILGQAKAEIKDQRLSARKAREQLGWRSRYSLDEALLETIEWYRTFFGVN